MSNIKLSIIIPCYNEGLKLIENIKKINQYILENIPDLTYEIIAVNDGSKDNTKELMDEFQNKLLHTTFLSYDINRGKGGAVKYGVENANGEWILFMDADLSTHLSGIKTVLEHTNNHKIIIGSRRHKESVLEEEQGFIRKITGIGCIMLTNLITRLWLLDTQCGFKAVETTLAKQIVAKQTINRWAFDVEWLYIAKMNGIRAYTIPVTWENDTDSKVSVVSGSVNFFLDLFKIVKNKKSYKF